MDEELAKTDWNKTAKNWITGCKIVIMALIFGILVMFTFEQIPLPYNVFVIGIELALSLMAVFMVIKSNNAPKKRHRKA